MADEGSSSSSSYEDSNEMNEQRSGKQGIPFNNPVPGMLAVSRLSQNPFAVTTAPAQSLADSTDYKESRPIVAPPTLRLGSGCKQEDMENILFDNGSPGSKEINSTSCESNGKVSKCEFVGTVWMSEGSSNLFVSSTSKGTASSSDDCGPSTKPGERAPGFVFGQNLHERASNYDDVPTQSLSPTNANLSFQEAATQQEDGDKPRIDEDKSGRLSKSLSESAEEYQSRQVKRKFNEVTVVTGEEDESNVLQMNCKLFAFNKCAGTWQERGRGILRLNDKEFDGVLHSRVVMRTQGSLRVVLNTKVWSAMSVEKPSPKTVRLSAISTDGVKVFLIMAHPKDAEQLFNALDWRVTALKSQEEVGKKGYEHATVEEATSSTSVEHLCRQEGNNDRKRLCLSSLHEGGADSSSEISFTRSESDIDNPADSTDTSLGSVGASGTDNADSENKSNS